MVDSILRLPAVKAITGLSRSTIYSLVSQGKEVFPQPIRLGQRSVGWVQSEIDAWIAAQIERSRKSA